MANRCTPSSTQKPSLMVSRRLVWITGIEDPSGLWG